MIDERAVSIPTQYVLLLVIVALLSSGLFVGIGGFVQSQQADAVRDGLSVAGTRLAADIVAADRLAASLDGAGALTVSADTPDQIAGVTYTIAIRDVEPGRSELVLQATNLDVPVVVDVVTGVDLAEGSVAGGPLLLVYDPANDRLEIRNA